MSLIPQPRSAARIGQVWPPLTANRYFTFWDWSTRATRVPPSIFTAVDGKDSAATSPVNAALFVIGVSSPKNSVQKFSSDSPRHFVCSNKGDRFWSFVSGDPVFAPIED